MSFEDSSWERVCAGVRVLLLFWGFGAGLVWCRDVSMHRCNSARVSSSDRIPLESLYNLEYGRVSAQVFHL